MEFVTQSRQQGSEYRLDLDNLLANAEIGALYLDADLKVRRVTPLMEKYTHFTAQDVGKYITDAPFMEEYSTLHADVAECAAKQVEIEREAVRDGNILLFRICPYLDETDRAAGVIVVLFDITSRRKKEEELRERSRKDAMTGLLNHTAVQKQIKERLDNCFDNAYLIVFDIDNFKQINDSNGHLFGDTVICTFAEKLQEQLPEAIKGRIGGDEFMAYVENIDQTVLEDKLAKINHFMADIYQENAIGQAISCSIGVAKVTNSGMEYDVTFQWADSALYEVKDGKKGSYKVIPVPADGSLPQKRYLPQDNTSNDYLNEEEAIVRTEEELVLFCMELLENVTDIHVALRLISERTCKFYGLDDMVCVEHAGDSNRILSCWSEIEKSEFTQRMMDTGVYVWKHLNHMTDPEGCIVFNAMQAPDIEMEAAQSAFLVLSTSVRDYTGSVVFADRKEKRDWLRMKSTLVRISNQIFYKLRLLKKEEEQRRATDLKLNYDALTGLPVYNRFIIGAKEYIEHYGNANLCCIYTDFSGFQYFNEIYGYEAGDGILKKFADCLTEKYGQCGLFARISSDNFVGIVRGDSVDTLAEEYRALTELFTNECNREYPRTNLVLASGIYGAGPADFSVAVMVDNANEARKKCKEQTVETMVKVYTDSLRQEIENAKAINSNILKGLKNKEFFAYMQPKVSLKTGKIVGAEALVRWIRPDGSRVMPDEFIGIAEKNGYITKIDFAVLEQTLEYLADAIAKGEEVVPISVNFSRRNNEFDDFVPNVLAKLEQYHIPSNLLEAEVTESVFMADLSTVDENMNRLREQGVEVSVDDFGSGYSSLNMLAKVSADTIKLDRLFLNNAKKDERGLTVIQYLTKMLKRLGFTVLAEGVETEEQLNWMRMADCDLVQGFYYAKPMSIEEFRIFMKEFNARVVEENIAEEV